MPTPLRLAIVLACPMIAGLTVVATYLGRETVTAAAWLTLGVGGMLFVRPVIGVCAMSGVYLLSAYPTVLQSFGFLTVNNVLGLGLTMLLVMRVLETRDLTFLRAPQVLLLAAIVVIFLLSVLHADAIFPLLRESRGFGRTLDRTEDMSHDLMTRLLFLVFMLAFVRTRGDVRALYLVFMLVTFVAIPSSLVNWAQGNLNRGYRAVASMTLGVNANKLAMICLMQVACWWCWMRAQPGLVRRGVGLGAIGGALVVLLMTGSRSGLLGAGVLLLLLQSGPRAFRASLSSIALFGCTAALVVLTLVPAQTWERMTTLRPEEGEIAASSNLKREDTLVVAMEMVQDHPWLGVGLGNFREVSRQMYSNPYFRPPHNSYLWALAEGGVFVFAGYLVLLTVTWRDARAITRLARRDREIGHIVAAFRLVFLLYCFFCLFADLWHTPLTYILIGLVVTMRRYLESLPDAAAPAVLVPRRPVWVRAAS